VTSPPPCDAAPKVGQVVESAGDRIKVAGDILDFTEFFVPDDQLPIDEKAFDKRIRSDQQAANLLSVWREKLAAAEPFDAETLEHTLHEFVGVQQIKISQMIHALRVAVTGKPVGLGMFDALAILGRDSCLDRIDRALERL